MFFANCTVHIFSRYAHRTLLVCIATYTFIVFFAICECGSRMLLLHQVSFRKSAAVQDAKSYRYMIHVLGRLSLLQLCCTMLPSSSFSPPLSHVSSRFRFVFGCKQWYLSLLVLCEDRGARLLMIGVKTKSLIYASAP